MTFPSVKDTTVRSEKPSIKKSRRWILAEQKSILQRHLPVQRPSEGRVEELYQVFNFNSEIISRIKKKDQIDLGSNLQHINCRYQCKDGLLTLISMD